MSGITKRKYISETIKISKKITKELHFIKQILPEIYDGEILYRLHYKYFPNTHLMLTERYQYHKKKDHHLISVGKKTRFNPLNSKNFFFSLQKVKHMLSNGYIKKHKLEYNQALQIKALKGLENKLKKSLFKKQTVVDNNEYIQNIEPIYIDIFIKIYHRSTHIEKILILDELKKFNNKKTITFFYKLNDSERNNQIRTMAFQHLQSLGKYVKLRKNFKGKKKDYHVDSTLPEYNPITLAKFLNSNSIESKKQYDIFISHSYLDKTIVKRLKTNLNDQNLSCYYDWTSDKDFLKRSLVSQYTIEVLKKRIEQSKIFILVLTHNVITEDEIISDWIKMEIEHAKLLGKKIFCINLANVRHEFIDIAFILENNSIHLTDISIID